MKTFTAPFAQTPKTSSATCTTADTLTGTDSVLLATAGDEGAILTKVSAMPLATVTATSLHLFISKDSGVTKKLIDSILMTAHTVATTTAIPRTVFDNITEATPIRLAAGDQLYVGTGVASVDGVVFNSEMTDF